MCSRTCNRTSSSPCPCSPDPAIRILSPELGVCRDRLNLPLQQTRTLGDANFPLHFLCWGCDTWEATGLKLRTVDFVSWRVWRDACAQIFAIAKKQMTNNGKPSDEVPHDAIFELLLGVSIGRNVSLYESCFRLLMVILWPLRKTTIAGSTFDSKRVHRGNSVGKSFQI